MNTTSAELRAKIPRSTKSPIAKIVITILARKLRAPSPPPRREVGTMSRATSTKSPRCRGSRRWNSRTRS
jgi:hypothetical protein